MFVQGESNKSLLLIAEPTRSSNDFELMITDLTEKLRIIRKIRNQKETDIYNQTLYIKKDAPCSPFSLASCSLPSA